MKFCEDHWGRLRLEIERREYEPGRFLADFIAKDGKQAIAQLADNIETEKTTLKNFDPLMNAHWAIVGNALTLLGDRVPDSALYLMQSDEFPEDPVEAQHGRHAGGPNMEGRTWSRCPLCYLNLAHQISCTDSKCVLDTERGYDFWIGKAADDQVAKAKELLAEARNEA